MPEPGMTEFEPQISLSPDKGSGGGGRNEDADKTGIDRARMENMEAAHLLEMFQRQGMEAKLDKLFDGIRDIDEVPVEKKEILEKEIALNYEAISNSSLDEIDVLQNYLDDIRNPFPYDSRWPIQFFESALKKANGFSRENDNLGPKGEGLLKAVKMDLTWGLSIARIVEAMGPTVEVYFDGELQMAVLRTPHGEIKEEDFARAFGNTSKGLELTETERNTVQEILLRLPENRIEKTIFKNRKDLYAGRERSPLRERAIKYQDRFNYWEFQATAAAQKNLEKGFKGRDDEEGEHYRKIDRIDFEFMSQLLRIENQDEETRLLYINQEGEKVYVINQLMNIYAMPISNGESYRFYQSIMHELVLDNEHCVEQLNKIKSDYNRPEASEDDKEIILESVRMEADKIRQRALERCNNWERLGEMSADDRLIDSVINSMILLDRGLLASGELGWGWEYEKGDFIVTRDGKDVKLSRNELTAKEWDDIVLKYIPDQRISMDDKREKAERMVQKRFVDENGIKREISYIVKRKSAFGGLMDDHDAHTVVFWARHIIDYDSYADTRGSILPPTIGFYRDRWFSEPPYWKPSLDEFARKDTLMLGRLGIDPISDGMLGKNNKWEKIQGRKRKELGKVGWQPQLYGKFDEGTAKYIRENVWAFVTPWLSKAGEKADDYFLVLPFFMPTMVEEINFWRNIRLDKAGAKPSENDTSYRESIWHKRLGGNKLSELKWENMNKYAHNWFRTNLDQFERILGPLVTPHKYNKMTAEEYLKHYQIPSGMADKESGKRGRLGMRGSKWASGIFRTAVLAQNKIITAMNNAGVICPTPGPGWEGIDIFLNSWRSKDVAPWQQYLLDMPEKVLNVNMYPGTAAQVAAFTYLQCRRIAKSAFEQFEGQIGSNEEALIRLENL